MIGVEIHSRRCRRHSVLRQGPEGVKRGTAVANARVWVKLLCISGQGFSEGSNTLF